MPKFRVNYIHELYGDVFGSYLALLDRRVSIGDVELKLVVDTGLRRDLKSLTRSGFRRRGTFSEWKEEVSAWA